MLYDFFGLHLTFFVQGYGKILITDKRNHHWLLEGNEIGTVFSSSELLILHNQPSTATAPTFIFYSRFRLHDSSPLLTWHACHRQMLIFQDASRRWCRKFSESEFFCLSSLWYVLWRVPWNWPIRRQSALQRCKQNMFSSFRSRTLQASQTGPVPPPWRPWWQHALIGRGSGQCNRPTCSVATLPSKTQQ